MKTAIAMKAGTADSGIDKHFGKCAFFCLIDEAKGAPEIIQNPGGQIQGCKADVIVNLLLRKKVSRVIAGDFGSHVQQLLNKHKIQMVIHPDETVSVNEIISLLTRRNK